MLVAVLCCCLSSAYLQHWEMGCTGISHQDMSLLPAALACPAVMRMSRHMKMLSASCPCRHHQVERVEQLRSFSFLSGLVAGFAVASLLQVNLDPTQISHVYQMGYAITVGLTVSHGL
jgi:hypothetical protein